MSFKSVDHLQRLITQTRTILNNFQLSLGRLMRSNGTSFVSSPHTSASSSDSTSVLSGSSFTSEFLDGVSILHIHGRNGSEVDGPDVNSGEAPNMFRQKALGKKVGLKPKLKLGIRLPMLEVHEKGESVGI